MACIIYKRTNKINHKVYIGQTWRTTEDRAGNNGLGYKDSPHFWNAIQKYGWNEFSIEELISCWNQDSADFYENYFQDIYDSRNPEKGYNIKEGGSHGRHSEETKQKISKAVSGEKHPMFGKNHTEETKQKMSENAATPWLGKSLSQEIKDKISEANTGNTHTEEWKEENSKFMKEWHANNEHPMQDQHHTEEAKEKISEASKGRKQSDETIEKRIKSRMLPQETQNRSSKPISMAPLSNKSKTNSILVATAKSIEY